MTQETELIPCPNCRTTDGFVERMSICTYQYLCDCGRSGPPVEKMKYEWHEGDPEGDAIKAWNDEIKALEKAGLSK